MKKPIIKAAKIIAICLFFITFNACKQHTIAKENGWTLDTDFSSISIITTKNNKIAEISEFQSFSGSINSSGYLNIEIDLNSLETNIPIRNERIAKHLFETSLFPTADIHTQLKPEDLSVGVQHIKFDIDLHGVSAIMEAEFMVFEQFGNKIITLHKPLVIKAETFALENGITTLKKLARLNSIDFTVPINLILSFKPQ